MKPTAIAATLALATTALVCEAADETKLDLKYGVVVQAAKSASAGAQQQSLPTPAVNRSCTVVVTMPADVRQNQDTLGATYMDNPIISAQSPTVWLEAALKDLSKHGYSTVSAGMPASSPTPRTATVSVDLDKLYVWNHSLNLHATLVVKATIVGGSGETLVRRYRVNSTKLNWWNADSELVDTVNLAAGRLLEQLATDIDGVCSSRRT